MFGNSKLPYWQFHNRYLQDNLTFDNGGQNCTQMPHQMHYSLHLEFDNKFDRPADFVPTLAGKYESSLPKAKLHTLQPA